MKVAHRLLMHSGIEEKRSKTEVMHFPTRHLLSSDKDTENLVLDNGSIVHFCTKFKYLGSIFTPDLTDFADINNRIQKASFALGKLCP